MLVDGMGECVEVVGSARKVVAGGDVIQGVGHHGFAVDAHVLCLTAPHLHAQLPAHALSALAGKLVAELQHVAALAGEDDEAVVEGHEFEDAPACDVAGLPVAAHAADVGRGEIQRTVVHFCGHVEERVAGPVEHCAFGLAHRQGFGCIAYHDVHLRVQRIAHGRQGVQVSGVFGEGAVDGFHFFADGRQPPGLVRAGDDSRCRQQE